MNRLVLFACAALSGVLLFLSFPPMNTGFLVFIALAPMLWAVPRAAPRMVFLSAWFSGLVFLGSSLFWIRHITGVGMVLAVLVLAVFHAVPFWLTGVLYRRSALWGFLVFPCAVAGMEWIRSFDQLAFPWMILGNSMTAYPALIQFADITSAFGVSWWVAAVNVCVLALALRPSLVRVLALALLFAVPWGYSRAVIDSFPPPGRMVRVALIQGNVMPEEKWADGLEEWNIELYRSMSRDAMAHDPDLIVWPETATPVYLADVAPYRRMVQTLVDSIGVPVLTGMPAKDFGTGETWNAAGLFVPGRTEVERYEKIHLVPFGEAIPLDNTFPSLRRFDFGQANWNEGSEVVVFDTPGIPPFNVAICFESIFPDLIRKFIVRGSRFIVVITNDVWFGPNESPIQHAMISVMRAIEFHRPVVRCANTGVTMIIDEYGRIVDRTSTFERTILAGAVAERSSSTFYLRHGNVFSAACFLVSILSLIAYLILSVRTGRRGAAVILDGAPETATDAPDFDGHEGV